MGERLVVGSAVTDVCMHDQQLPRRCQHGCLGDGHLLSLPRNTGVLLNLGVHAQRGLR